MLKITRPIFAPHFSSVPPTSTVYSKNLPCLNISTSVTVNRPLMGIIS